MDKGFFFFSLFFFFLPFSSFFSHWQKKRGELAFSGIFVPLSLSQRLHFTSLFYSLCPWCNMSTSCQGCSGRVQTSHISGPHQNEKDSRSTGEGLIKRLWYFSSIPLASTKFARGLDGRDRSKCSGRNTSGLSVAYMLFGWENSRACPPLHLQCRVRSQLGA
ncbi:uncharacterized protein IWZ02DRAFT_7170 [Phyllosticta citriasiana]|uniref:uncharacterized protein n=1 Tax=Phyllosticta citriasiana TaxID=595635 RepID=UPI0030FD5905